MRSLVKKKATNKTWYQKNAERIKAEKKSRYWADIKQGRADARRHATIWRERNPELALTKPTEWRKTHPEQARKIARDWNHRHPEQHQSGTKKRRAQRYNVVHEPWTTISILERDTWTCQVATCIHPQGRKISKNAQRHGRWEGTADHIVPLAKGGPDVPSNLQAAHRACNSVKGTSLGGEY